MRYIRSSVSVNPIFLLENDGKPLGITSTDFGETIQNGSICIDTQSGVSYMYKSGIWKAINNVNYSTTGSTINSTGIQTIKKFFIWDSPNTSSITASIDLPGIELGEQQRLLLDLTLTTSADTNVGIIHNLYQRLTSGVITFINGNNWSNFFPDYSIIVNTDINGISIEKQIGSSSMDVFIKYEYQIFDI